MAKKPFISVDGITVGEANALVNVILANGDITTSNITIGNNANLGNVGNIIITGGSSGYVLSTNGSGNLSWIAQSGGGGSTSNISNGNSNVNIATENGNITMSAVGNANIVVVTGTGANINGLLSVTGNIIPTSNIIYNLGNNTNRFKDLYLSGNTINLGDSNFSSNATTVTITNPLGGQFIVGGTETVNSANLTGYSIANGNSNVSVVSNGNVNISSAGNANILTVTGTGANITGTLNVTGNATVGNIITGAGSGGNITGANVISANTITASGNITAGNANLGNLVTANFFTGNGSLLTGISTGGISNGNSNISIPTANGNVNISAVGNANVLVITGTGANIAGTLNVTGNTTVGNLLSSGSGGNITNANVISANTFTASGNITAGNANLGNAVTANYFIGTFYGTANSATTATSATTAGTVTTAAQPNITSVGTLTSLSVSGTGSFGANVNLNSFNITNLATPVASTDAATKQYVDDVAQGLNVHDAVAAATPTTLATITSGTITYNNGSSGVGANLTTTGTFNLIDGVNVQTSGTRILVKNEANAVFNGIYTWSNATVITRATDYNTVPEVEAGDFVFVSGGTLYDNTGWVQTSTVTAIGTAGNNIEFTQFSGAGTYQAGTGLTLTGSTFSVNASQTQITSVGTLGNLTVTGNATVGNLVTSGSGGTLSNINVVSANTFTASGNITAGNANLGNLVTANFFTGNGSLLTGITVSAGNTIVNGNSNVVILANGNVSTSVAGNANILIVTGTGVNIAGTLNTTGNLTAGNANITGTINVTGNANVGNIGAAAGVFTTVTGSLTTAAQPNITSVGTLTSLAVTGNISSGNANLGNLVIANFFSGNGSLLTGITVSAGNTIVNGNSNVIVTANGNVTTSVAGNANILIVTGTGVNVAGTLNVTGNATVGSLLTSGSGGNVSNVNVISANTFIASGNITAGNANITGTISVTGNANVGNIGAAAGVFTTVTGSLTTASQPNITSVGTLTSLSVTGNISSGNANLGNLATANFFSGSGNNLSNIQGGNVTGQVGNALVAGTVYTAAQPNITSVGTLTGITSTGTINLTGASNVSLGAVGNVKITGGTNAYVLSTDGSGNLSWVAQSGGGNVSSISNGNSNVNIPTSNGNINFTAVGNTSMVITGTGVNVAGTLNVTGNANVSNIGATNGVFTNVSGNGSGLSSITGANVTGTVSSATNAVSATTAGSASTAGYATNAGSATSAGYANVVTDNAQPNITSVGTLTSLAVTGTANLGAVGNVKITGGSNGYVLSTDGTGNLSWASQTGSNIVVDSFTGNGVQTVFTLTNTPTSEDYTIINIDGVSQLHSAYTVANANVTLSSAPANGAAIEVMTFNLGGGAGGGGGSSGYTYVEATGNTAASVNTKYIVNTNTANLTITLPSTPSFGDEVGIIDGTGNASVHAITVARNGGNIQGAASDMTVTTDRSAFTLVYYNASQGWVLTNV